MKTVVQTAQRLRGGLLLTIVFAALFTIPNIARAQSVSVSITAPGWAPEYSYVERVHYYYLPDLEVYYDVWNHEFVYLEDGSWIYTPVLPPMYADYDLYSSYVVVLDYRVHEPWHHHQMYVGHYPRYYYRSVYHTDDDRPDNRYYGARGFSENQKQVVYSHNGGGNSSHNVPTNNSHNVPNGSYNAPAPTHNTPINNNHTENHPQVPVNPSQGERNPTKAPGHVEQQHQPGRVESPIPGRRSAPVEYHDRGVGAPVHVQRNMTPPPPSRAQQAPAPRQAPAPAPRQQEPAHQQGNPHR